MQELIDFAASFMPTSQDEDQAKPAIDSGSEAGE
jgi:hypothetical protein